MNYLELKQLAEERGVEYSEGACRGEPETFVDGFLEGYLCAGINLEPSGSRIYEEKKSK
jgi:hypothetical protein